MKRLSTFLNVVGYYLAWWACVYGAMREMPMLGTVPTWIFLALHLYGNHDPRKEATFLLIAVSLGTATDSLFAATGLLTYKGGYASVPWLAPLWITALWGGFAATMNHSLRWMRRRMVLASFLAAVAAPLSYIGGERLGVVKLSTPLWWPSLWLALAWLVLIPSLLLLSGGATNGEPHESD